MSVTGLNTRGAPNSLTGLETITSSISGKFVPYNGAQFPVNLGSQKITSTYSASSAFDLVNLQVLTNAVTYVDNANALTYLNKVTSTSQSVQGEVEFKSNLRLSNANSSIDLGDNISTTSRFQIFGGTSPQFRYNAALTFMNQTIYGSDNVLLLQGTDVQFSQLYTNTVPYLDASKSIKSSAVTPTELGYLSGVTSSIQTQFNTINTSIAGLVPYTGATANVDLGSYRFQSSADPVGNNDLLRWGYATSKFVPYLNATSNVDLGSYRCQSSAAPSGGNDLTNKTYVDGAISGAGSLYLLKTGGTMTGDITMGSNKITSTATPATDDTLTRKGYVDTQDALKANLAGLNTFTGVNTFSSALAINLSAYTGNRVLVLDASKNVNFSSISTTELDRLSGVSSNIQTQLDAKASTSYVDTGLALKVNKAGDTMSGNLAMGSNKITSSYVPVNTDDLTNKNYVDAGLALKPNLAGTNTFTGVNTFNSTVNLAGYAASRALALDASKNIVTSSATFDELGYLSGVSSSIQTQINSLSSNFANYLPLTGGTLSGALGATKFYGPNFSTNYQKANDTDKWFKILQIPAGATTASGEFVISYSVAGNHAHIYFSIGTMYNSTPIIRLEKSTFYGGPLVDKIRLSLDSGNIYGEAFVELHTSPQINWFSNNCTIRVYQLNQAPTNSDIVVLQSKTAGTTTGYTYYEVVTNAGFDYNYAGNKLTFDGQLYPIITPSRITITNSNPGDLISKRYGSGDRYGIGQYDGGITRVFTSNAYAPSEIRLSLATNDDMTGSASFTDLVTITHSGNVGIGTATPITSLHIARAFTANGDYSGMISFENTTAGGYLDWQLGPQVLDGAACFSLRGGADGLGSLSNLITVSGGGNLGLGTTNPSTKLEIIGSQTMIGVRDISSTSYSAIRLGNNRGYGCYWFLNGSSRLVDGGGNTATFRNDLGTLRLQSDGGGGITITGGNGSTTVLNGATTYNNSFIVETPWAGVLLNSTSSGGRKYVMMSSVSGAGIGAGHFGIWDETAATYRMRIHSNGNVTFGNPDSSDSGYKLDVIGASRATEVYTSNWFRVNANGGGLYWQNLGYGIVSANAYDSNANPTLAGNVQCYGTPKGDFHGYNVPFSPPPNTSYGGLSFSSERFSNSYGGILHTWGNGPSNTWPVFIRYNEINTTYLGAGSVRCSQDWDLLMVYMNGYDTSGGYFYVNKGGGYGVISDSRIKQDFQAIEVSQSEAFLKAIEPTSFCIKHSHSEEVSVISALKPSVCSCRQDGWLAQNVLEACKASGASKSVVNYWYDYEQELEKPEEERKTLLGVSDRPILSHTVNVVKGLMEKIEKLNTRLNEQAQLIADLSRILGKFH